MSSFEEIERCLEQHSVLSASWLANELQINVRSAIDLLQQYRNSVEGIIASYRLSTKSSSGAFRIEIVSEENELTQDINTSVLFRQLYSIQRTTSELTKSKLVEVSLLQAEELLNTTTATSGSFLDNAFGGVKVTGLDIRAVGGRIFSSQNLNFDAASACASAALSRSETAESAQAPIRQTTFSTVKSSSFSSGATAAVAKASHSLPASSSATLKRINERNAEAAKRFFAAVPQQNPDELDTSGVGAGDDAEEWDDGAPKRKIPAKVKVESQDTATPEMDLGVLDSLNNAEATAEDENVGDEMDAASTEQEESDKTDTMKKQKKSKKAKIDVLKRGAMDDYMEDVAIEEFKRKAENEGSEQAAKKKKRVLVEKSFVDDRGYFVTEMVYDEVTDDESDSMPNKAAIGGLKPKVNVSNENTKHSENKKAAMNEDDGKATKGKKAEAKEKPAATAAAAVGGQKSVMSFFKKT